MIITHRVAKGADIRALYSLAVSDDPSTAPLCALNTLNLWSVAVGTGDGHGPVTALGWFTDVVIFRHTPTNADVRAGATGYIASR